MELPTTVRVVEVGPRDGLQNESAVISTDAKLQLIALLADAGLRHIEATSFVHPKAVPQLADGDVVAARLPRSRDVTYSALVPNERGLQRALDAGLHHIAVFTAASETFTRRNINMSIAESLTVFRQVCARARRAGVSIRGYVSTCFTCPFEGPIDPQAVSMVASELLGMGCGEVVISDTVGAAVPTDIARVLGTVGARIPVERMALHLHDTCGTALANVLAGLHAGITTFDGAVGGLGGCPFAPGAAGNLATEDLVYLLNGMGISTGIDEARLLAAARFIAGLVQRPLPSHQLGRSCTS